MSLPLVVTQGEPAGVGPEIIVKAWRALRRSGPPFVVVGDARLLDRAADEVVSTCIAPAGLGEASKTFTSRLPVIDRPLDHEPVLGAPSSANASKVIAWIEEAVILTRCGKAAALVTAPIAKATLYEAGFAFPGHTEFLGALMQCAPVMMLAAADLRVSLVTVHVPLARVPSLVTREAIVHVGLITREALRRDFAIASPRMALAALNPHAGEGGALGGEEVADIVPAAEDLRAKGVDLTGPLPADTLFHPDARSRHDAIICLYHDQALIPAKMLDFWGAVNVTLGLPIVRTSPDHGVGLDIAGKGVARPDSLIAALRLADQIAERRRLTR